MRNRFMSRRETIRNMFAGQGAPDGAFWLGNPHPDTWPMLHEYFGTAAEEDLRGLLNDDFRWVCPQWNSYQHPCGKPMFDMQREGGGLSCGGVLAECESVSEVDRFPWPNPDYLDFTESLATLDSLGDVYRASAFWAPFYHEVADFFGMENYFVKMCTHPDVVRAVTRHMVDFYLEANRRFFAAAGDKIDAVFCGNDLGTQMDLQISPAMFEIFMLPYLKELIDQAHQHSYAFILHSCGSIYRIIPQLIDAGVDGLHPLQARAAHMDAETLGASYGDKLVWIGGIDTQKLLVEASPGLVRDEVNRVRECLGSRVIISPSHEALLSDVRPENVEAMARAARHTAASMVAAR
ncbi:MAG: hypothetical protein GF418_09175 [Chitinivibrionales bacterium]|nr:hypothetical protein [Chitinivibrionales bacterium]MBD3395779.1 hypothetical protein [Chitinivibrionales bacterium]